MSIGLQELFETQGFIVLAYTDPLEYSEERSSKIVKGATVNSSIPDDQLLRVIGEASPEEWSEQCALCGDPVHMPELEAPHVGFLKVVAE